MEDDALWFPDPEQTTAEGLLCIGGDLRPERLLLAYSSGIFPWYGEEDPILWWCPPVRCVLFPDQLKVSKSMQMLLRKGAFQFSVDTAFDAVIEACAHTLRKGQPGTWITPEMIDAYKALHQSGHAHSAEVWQDGVLVGGLYGVRIGRVFCGESMFSHVSNASKAAFIHYVRKLQSEGIVLIDCQNETPHLLSLGAEMISRRAYLQLLKQWSNNGR